MELQIPCPLCEDDSALDIEFDRESLNFLAGKCDHAKMWSGYDARQMFEEPTNGPYDKFVRLVWEYIEDHFSDRDDRFED